MGKPSIERKTIVTSALIHLTYWSKKHQILSTSLAHNFLFSLISRTPSHTHHPSTSFAHIFLFSLIFLPTPTLNFLETSDNVVHIENGEIVNELSEGNSTTTPILEERISRPMLPQQSRKRGIQAPAMDYSISCLHAMFLHLYYPVFFS